MSKIRVYDLAKEAGMDSKDLTAKLIDEGYDIKAYNSSIDDDMANDIRLKLGLIKTEIEKKRIQAKGRPTVIRRRKKVVLQEASEDEAPLDGAAEDDTEADGSVTVAESAEPDAAGGAVLESSPEGSGDDASLRVASESAGEGVGAVPTEPAVETAGDEEAAAERIGPPEDQMTLSSEAVPAAAMATAPAEEFQEPDVEVGEYSQLPAGEEAETAEPAESLATEEFTEDGEEGDGFRPKKKKIEKSRKGLARIIKKSAIDIPVSEPVRPKAKKIIPKPQKPRPETIVDKSMGGGADVPDPETERAKGKKGKRYVKFVAEPVVGREKARKGKRQTAVIVEMDEVAELGGRLASGLKVGRTRRTSSKKSKHAFPAAETKAIKKRIRIFESILIGDFAKRMGVKVNEVIVKLIGLGVMATVNQALDVDTATLIATEFGYEVEQGITGEQSILDLEEKESGGIEFPRPPVVTVMGHVDHGKTSILDAIRNTDVAGGEAGGITQHIGAHYVRSSQGDVVFLDTPGHEAFTEMRARGAKVTDIVVLVVAADDGVMNQTKEAINHARAAGVPIVVAVNKMDKANADLARVKRELADLDLVPEEWGGQTIYCETSAKQNSGIDNLLEQILLQSEILELKADPKRRARGRVIEAHLHKGRGAVASILVQQGTLRVGDAFVIGEFSGKIRSIYNDKGQAIKDAGPSMPVEIHGLSGVPQSGDEFMVVHDEKLAKSVAAQRQLRNREENLASYTKISLDNLFEKLKEVEVKELKILLRADVQGTLEAFGKAIEKLSTDEIKVKIIHEGTGGIIDSDVLLASASEAIILGFNVRPTLKVQEFAAKSNVDIRYYNVIYHALDDIRKAMVGMLDPVYQERVIGNVEVRDIFHHPKAGTIAGSYVTSGKVERNSSVRLIREGVVIFTGKLKSLRRFKDDVKEVQTGYECGISLENFNDVKVGDNLEAYVMDEVEAEL